MPVIDPDGLFDGERLSACSDKAKLYWPYLYCISNGYARLEVNVRYIRQRCFGNFAKPPTEEDIGAILKEYAENYLILPYESGGRQWVQFDTATKYLPKHKSKKDESSPSPTVEEMEAFNQGYVAWKKTRSGSFGNFLKSSPDFSKVVHGIGIGTGVGIGEGIGDSPALETQEEDTDMKATKQIPILCQAILKTKADMFPSTVGEIQRLERTYKGSAVINAFKEWAEDHLFDELRSPVAAFLKDADEILGGGSPAKAAASDPTVQDLVCELVYQSRNLISFDDRQKARLAQHLRKYTPEELTAAFKDFWASIDQENVKARSFAGKTFAESADQLAYSIRRSRQESSSLSVAMESTKARVEQEAALERQQQVSQEEVEETLG